MKKIHFTTSLFFLLFINFAYAQNLNISGQVIRHNGTPMSNVNVSCSNGDSTLTDQNGFYQFSNLIPGENYQINANYYSPLFEELTVLDATYARYMILEILDYTSPQWIAYDFDQFGNYSGTDYYGLVNAILNIENPALEYYAEDHPWRFFDTAVDLIVNLVDVETGINLINLSSDTTNLNLYGIKSGDVAFEEDHLPPPPTAPQPLFYIPETSISANEEVVIPIMARDLGGVMGWQYAITWDTSFLNFTSQECLIQIVQASANQETVDEGLLRMLGVNIFLEEIQDDTTLYELRFQALQDASSLSDLIDFDSMVFKTQAVYVESQTNDADFYLIEPTFSIGTPITSSIDKVSKSISFDLSPNPAFDYLNFSMQRDQNEPIQVSLFNAMGKLIQQESFNDKMVNEQIDISKLTKGIYHLRVETSEVVSSRSFVKF